MQAKSQKGEERVVEHVDRERITDFIYLESRLLDLRRFEDWLALYDEDGSYWVPSQVDQKSPLDDVSIFYDDKELMRTRVARLNHPRIHIDDPQTRSVRMLNNIEIERAEPGDDYELRVRAVLCAVIYFQRQQYVYGGRCEYTLRDRDKLSILSKRVDLVNCDGLLPPLVVPF